MRRRRLAVKLEEVASLRDARAGKDPDPVAAAVLARLGGADGISLHLRDDRRYPGERDARMLRDTVPAGFALELSPASELVKTALDVQPDWVTLVGHRFGESRTAEGVDVLAQMAAVGDVVRMLGEAQIRTRICIRPDLDHVKGAHRLGARGIRLHAARYAEGGPDRDEELQKMADCARLAAKLDLDVAIGGDLDYRSVGPILELEHVHEIHVGHAIVARAVLSGMEAAVRDMRALVG